MLKGVFQKFFWLSGGAFLLLPLSRDREFQCRSQTTVMVALENPKRGPAILQARIGEGGGGAELWVQS